MLKATILFLLVMVVIGMVGNLLYPGALGRQVKRRLTGARKGTCPRCGRPVIGRACDCGRKGS